MLTERGIEPGINGGVAAAVEATSTGIGEESSGAGSSGFNTKIDLGECFLVVLDTP